MHYDFYDFLSDMYFVAETDFNASSGNFSGSVITEETLLR
jgi:hypothetical protein